jgi:hypothetical protein
MTAKPTETMSLARVLIIIGGASVLCFIVHSLAADRVNSMLLYCAIGAFGGSFSPILIKRSENEGNNGMMSHQSTDPTLPRSRLLRGRRRALVRVVHFKGSQS